MRLRCWLGFHRWRSATLVDHRRLVEQTWNWCEYDGCRYFRPKLVDERACQASR